MEKIRGQYTEDWKSKEMRVRQRCVPLLSVWAWHFNPAHFPLLRAVALYFIDKLALRAGNEKDTDESADTVGCCSLRVEHMSEEGCGQGGVWLGL